MEEKTQGISEDWLSLWLGLFIFVLSLGVMSGVDILGWGVKPNMWTDLSKAVSPISKNYGWMSGWLSLFLTYVAFMVVLGVGVRALKGDLGKFFYGFTIMPSGKHRSKQPVSHREIRRLMVAETDW